MNLPEVALTDVPEAPAFAPTEDVYGRANSFMRELDWETIMWKATVRGYREIQAGPPRTYPATTLSGMSAAWILRQPGVDMIIDNWSSDNAGLAAIRQEFNSTQQSRANAARRIHVFTTHFIPGTIPFLVVPLGSDFRIDWNPAFLDKMIARRCLLVDMYDETFNIRHGKNNSPAMNAAMDFLAISSVTERIVASTITWEIACNLNRDRVRLGLPACDSEVKRHLRRLTEATDAAQTEDRELADDLLNSFRTGQVSFSPLSAGTLRETALYLRHLARPAREGVWLTTEDINRLLIATGGPATT